MGIASAHVRDEFALLRGVLIGMVMRPSGTVTQGLDRAIIATFSAVDVLPIDIILYSSLGDTKTFGIAN